MDEIMMDVKRCKMTAKLCDLRLVHGSVFLHTARSVEGCVGDARPVIPAITE